jgi:hypothetical protein
MPQLKAIGGFKDEEYESGNIGCVEVEHAQSRI